MAAPVFGSHPGYLFNVLEEKNKRDIEMVMLDKPKPERKPPGPVIVNEKLSREFQEQYRYRFGQTQAEQVINNPSRDAVFIYSNTQRSITFEEYRKYQNQFAEYMIRRLTEYHFDNWAKNDPAIRPVYLMKDKISNVNLQVKKGYKVKLKYNFAGPSFEVKVENPYDLDVGAQAMMSGIISKPRDIIFTLGYQLTDRVQAQTLYRTEQHLKQLVLSRRMTKRVWVSFTSSTGLVPGYTDISQTLTLVGLSWSE